MSDDLTARARAVLARTHALDRRVLSGDEPANHTRWYARCVTRLQKAGLLSGAVPTDLGREVARLLTEGADHA